MVFCLTLLRSKVITDREIDASGTSTKHYMSRFQKGEMSEEDAQKMRDLLQKASLLSDVSFKGNPKQTNQWTWKSGSRVLESASEDAQAKAMKTLFIDFIKGVYSSFSTHMCLHLR